LEKELDPLHVGLHKKLDEDEVVKFCQREEEGKASINN
jgi:hypothetical protein